MDLPKNELIYVKGKAYHFKCYTCGKELIRYEGVLKKNKPQYVFCSRECKHAATGLYPMSEERKERYREMFKGKNNPNYNNRWTKEQRDALSTKCVERYKDSAYYEKFCEANRNRTWTEEGRRNVGDAARITMANKIRVPHTEEVKHKIGIASAAKFNKEGFKDHMRKVMEERGYWIPLNQKSAYEVYYEDSNWIAPMFSLCNEQELVLLNEYGVFNNRTNTKGVVRDHKIGRRAGYEMGIPPYLMHHPCNCQIITHSDNVKKSFCRNDTVISKEDLYQLILKYDKPWDEQDMCVEYIKGLDWYKTIS